MNVIGSEFFLKLAEIGQTQIPLFASKILQFLNTKVSSFFELFKVNDIPFLTTRQNWLSSLWNSIVGFSKDLTTSYLRMFGFNLDMPVWEFILMHIGLILAISLVLRLLSILT